MAGAAREIMAASRKLIPAKLLIETNAQKFVPAIKSNQSSKFSIFWNIILNFNFSQINSWYINFQIQSVRAINFFYYRLYFKLIKSTRLVYSSKSIIIKHLWNNFFVFTEVISRRRSVKKVILKTSQNSQGSTCARVSFNNVADPVNFAKFSRIPFCRFCWITSLTCLRALRAFVLYAPLCLTRLHALRAFTLYVPWFLRTLITRFISYLRALLTRDIKSLIVSNFKMF